MESSKKSRKKQLRAFLDEEYDRIWASLIETLPESMSNSGVPGFDSQILEVERFESDFGDLPPAEACDCGAEKARTPHARWCSTMR